MPLSVSVALCTYNGERYLDAQLASIAAQTRLPSELVVTDDASSDGTVSRLEAFAAHAPFPVRLRRHERNAGSTASFEETIAACTGALVALCDQDDVWLPQKLERLAHALESDARAGYVFSDADLVDRDLAPLGKRMWETVGMANGAARAFAGERQIEMLLERTRVTGATMMIRASRLAPCRPFPAGVVHDRWLAAMLSGIGAFGIALDAPLVAYRQHAAQQIGARHTPHGFSLRALGREFVLARRRKMRSELAVARTFVAQLDRLLAQPGALNADESVQARRSRTLAVGSIEHVAERASLSRGSLVRAFATIGRELAVGNYRRYSGGWAAVGADLLYCARHRRGDPDA